MGVGRRRGVGIRDGYCPRLDAWGTVGTRWLVRWSGQHCLSAYQRRGYAVANADQIAALPLKIRDAQAKEAAQCWKRWLYLGALGTMVAGPIGPAIGFGLMIVVLSGWGAEVGWAYGVDMAQAEPQQQLRRMLGDALAPAMGISPVSARWSERAKTAATWLLGQDIWLAERIMAGISQNLRTLAAD